MGGKGCAMGSGTGGSAKAFNQTPTGWISTEPRHICQKWAETLGPTTGKTSHLCGEVDQTQDSRNHIKPKSDLRGNVGVSRSGFVSVLSLKVRLEGQ